MKDLEMHPTFEATSAAGAMLTRQVREPMLVGCLLAGLGTSTAYGITPAIVLRAQRTAEQTTAGASISVAAPAGAAIGELRRLSGFTWDQLARLFNVSRRSLHFWASGKPMASSNEEHLQRLPFDLLAAGHYERVLSLLGPGEARRVSPPKLSAEAHAARAARPPEELVGALQDRIHRDGGTARAAKSVRNRSGR
jgi:DNA-binding transcriptional regulator YiaG